ncbi:MAG: SgcJ/EcaC family oxidoreductase [Vicinamibacterales bacterium]|nr:SgcJ/EcaC family oxidoreductase [Vicinamibacterales bacterium]
MTVSARPSTAALPCTLLLLLAACGRVPAPPGGDEQAVRDVVARYEAASNEGDAVALAALYADDALLLPPDGDIVAGRDAILAFWQDGIESGIAFEVVASFLMEANATAPADSGKYVLCLRRQRDGAWRVVADMWNATPSTDDLDTDDGGDPRTSVTSAAARRMTEKPIIRHISSKYIAPRRGRR